MNKKKILKFWLVYGLLLGVTGFILGEVLVRLLSKSYPGVRTFATSGVAKPPKTYKTFEEFIKDQLHLIPGRNWANYYTNKYGFYDEEFETPKPAGRYRIMALGDSFCYSMVAYPASVLAVTEKIVKKHFQGHDVEIMNFGIPASEVPEYKNTFLLGHKLFEPDMVLLHFYMGNDGPNHYEITTESVGKLVSHSYLFGSLKNLYRVNRHVQAVNGKNDSRNPLLTRKEKEQKVTSAGGEKVDHEVVPYKKAPERFIGPTFTEEAFTEIAGRELGRWYDAKDGSARRNFRKVLEDIEAIRLSAEDNGIEFAIVLYPSVLQINDEMRKKYIARIKKLDKYRKLDPARINPDLPNDILKEYSKKHNVTLFDLTEPMKKAVNVTGKTLYIQRDTHWNVAGNQLAAEIEAGFLIDLIGEERANNM